jgi:hypothetical protein
MEKDELDTELMEQPNLEKVTQSTYARASIELKNWTAYNLISL